MKSSANWTMGWEPRTQPLWKQFSQLSLSRGWSQQAKQGNRSVGSIFRRFSGFRCSAGPGMYLRACMGIYINQLYHSLSYSCSKSISGSCSCDDHSCYDHSFTASSGSSGSPEQLTSYSSTPSTDASESGASGSSNSEAPSEASSHPLSSSDCSSPAASSSSDPSSGLSWRSATTLALKRFSRSATSYWYFCLASKGRVPLARNTSNLSVRRPSNESLRLNRFSSMISMSFLKRVRVCLRALLWPEKPKRMSLASLTICRTSSTPPASLEARLATQQRQNRLFSKRLLRTLVFLSSSKESLQPSSMEPSKRALRELLRWRGELLKILRMVSGVWGRQRPVCSMSWSSNWRMCSLSGRYSGDSEMRSQADMSSQRGQMRAESSQLPWPTTCPRRRSAWMICWEQSLTVSSFFWRPLALLRPCTCMARARTQPKRTQQDFSGLMRVISQKQLPMKLMCSRVRQVICPQCSKQPTYKRRSPQMKNSSLPPLKARCRLRKTRSPRFRLSELVEKISTRARTHFLATRGKAWISSMLCDMLCTTTCLISSSHSPSSRSMPLRQSWRHSLSPAFSGSCLRYSPSGRARMVLRSLGRVKRQTGMRVGGGRESAVVEQARKALSRGRSFLTVALGRSPSSFLTASMYSSSFRLSINNRL